MLKKRHYFSTFVNNVVNLFSKEARLFSKSIPFLNSPRMKSNKRKTYGKKKLALLLTQKKMTEPTHIVLQDVHGTMLSEYDEQSLQLTDTPVEGEHFAASHVLLSKGLYYFVFETMPTTAELFIYMISGETGLLFSWLNLPEEVGGWNKFGDRHDFEAIFSQRATSKTAEKLKIVIYSSLDQHIQLRWQHGHASDTIYDGSIGNKSIIRSVQFGKIVTC